MKVSNLILKQLQRKAFLVRISFLICCLYTGSVRGQNKEEVIVQSGHFGRINHVTFSADNRLLASSGDDLTLRIWHLSTGKLMATFQHTSAVVSSCFYKPNDQIVSISSDGVLQIWSIANSELVKTMKLINTATVRAKISTHKESIYALLNGELFKAENDRAEFQKIEIRKFFILSIKPFKSIVKITSINK